MDDANKVVKSIQLLLNSTSLLEEVINDNKDNYDNIYLRHKSNVILDIANDLCNLLEGVNNQGVKDGPEIEMYRNMIQKELNDSSNALVDSFTSNSSIVKTITDIRNKVLIDLSSEVK